MVFRIFSLLTQICSVVHFYRDFFSNNSIGFHCYLLIILCLPYHHQYVILYFLSLRYSRKNPLQHCRHHCFNFDRLLFAFIIILTIYTPKLKHLIVSLVVSEKNGQKLIGIQSL